MTLKNDCMEVFQRILPLFNDPRPGHCWTGRLELQGLIERLTDAEKAPAADLVERMEASELREYLVNLPAAQYTFDECIKALREETLKFQGKSSPATPSPSVKKGI